jgi:DNA repair photolyase
MRNPRVGRIWNPVNGICKYKCAYCKEWIQALYRGDTTECVLKKDCGIPEGYEWIVVAIDTDLFAENVSSKIIEQIFEKIKERSNQTFILLTKNPKRYLMHSLPDNVSCSTTVETDINYRYISSAPTPLRRLYWLRKLRELRPQIRIEIDVQPIMDFNFHRFFSRLIAIKPNLVSICYDTRRPEQKLFMPHIGRMLIEPSEKKAKQLADALTKTGIDVFYSPKKDIENIRKRHMITVDVSSFKNPKAFLDLFTAGNNRSEA